MIYHANLRLSYRYKSPRIIECLILVTGREIPFILMPYPIFKDSTGKELHFIGRDKVDLNNDKIVSDDVVAHEKIAQNRRRSLPVPSRKWIIDWKNNG